MVCWFTKGYPAFVCWFTRGYPGLVGLLEDILGWLVYWMRFYNEQFLSSKQNNFLLFVQLNVTQAKSLLYLGSALAQRCLPGLY